MVIYLFDNSISIKAAIIDYTLAIWYICTMDEEPGKSDHRECDYAMAKEALGLDPFLGRKQRFDEKVIQASIDPGSFGEDILYYTDSELIQAYEEVERLGMDAIEAIIKYKESFHLIVEKRQEIKAKIQENRMRRNLGSDALHMGDICAAEDTD
jgi:hypothetical protein